MDEEFARFGSPARLTADDMVRRAILDVLDEILPGARTKVSELAHARLAGAERLISPGSRFFRDTHCAIDAIVQAPTG